MGVDLGARVVEGGDQQILKHLDLFRVDDRLVDLDPLDVALAVQGQLHHAAAGHAGHLDGFELRLHLGHLLLHLLRLLHQLADVLHEPSSPAPFASPFSSLARPSPRPSSPALSSAASVPASAAAKRSRTAAIVAPGKVSSTARTNGWAATSFRSALARCASCWARVASPSACETATIQRAPVHSPSNWPSRLARSRGAPSAGRNSMRPGSNATRWACDQRCERSSASRRLSNSSTISAKLCGIGSSSM